MDKATDSYSLENKYCVYGQYCVCCLLAHYSMLYNLEPALQLKEYDNFPRLT